MELYKPIKDNDLSKNLYFRLKSKPMLEVKNLSFSYSEKKLIDEVSFSVEKCEIISLLGRSGCGKTTLFRLLAGLSKQIKGTIHLAGEISYMTQHPLLLPWRSVFDNLLLLRELGKNKDISKKQFEEKIEYFLNEVGLLASKDLYPHEISGGMQSRVSLARALLEDKELLLLDEPFAYLDAITRQECQDLLLRLQKKYAKSIILVTHDIEEAVRLSDRIFLLSCGKITQNWLIPCDSLQKPALVQTIKNSL